MLFGVVAAVVVVVAIVIDLLALIVFRFISVFIGSCLAFSLALAAVVLEAIAVEDVVVAVAFVVCVVAVVAVAVVKGFCCDFFFISVKHFSILLSASF